MSTDTLISELLFWNSSANPIEVPCCWQRKEENPCWIEDKRVRQEFASEASGRDRGVASYGRQPIHRVGYRLPR